MNIFGGNVGGPLYIPGVYNTETKKTFFFWNEEWRKIVQGELTCRHSRCSVGRLHHLCVGLQLCASCICQCRSGRQGYIPYTDNPAYNTKLVSLGLTPPTKNSDGSINYQAFPNNMIPGALIDPVALQYNSVGAIPESERGRRPDLGFEQAAHQCSRRPLPHRPQHQRQVAAPRPLHSRLRLPDLRHLHVERRQLPTVGSTFSNPSNSVVHQADRHRNAQLAG